MTFYLKRTLKFFPFAVNRRSSNCKKKKETRWNYILKHLCGGSENIEFEWDRTWTKSLSMLWSFPLDCKSESHFATSVDYCLRRRRHRHRSTTDERTDVFHICIYTQIFSHEKSLVQFFFQFFFKIYYATFQYGCSSVFKKILEKKFDPKKVKIRASKVANNWPRPFHFTVQPRPQPSAQNWFVILWNLGTRHLFSYLCTVHRWCHCSTTNKVPRIY